jgi:2-(1,2-epoxy-1,2-dihydrophenyl)acetyl-CoA isomerase
MVEQEILLSDRDGAVLTLTFNRPKANAFNQEMVDRLLASLDSAEADEGVRSIVITGKGKLFSAGQDVGELGLERVSFRQLLERTYNRLILRMRWLEKPIVAAINGPVAGAALGIALAADLRVAARGAKLVFGFTGIGLTADSGTSLMLPLLAGLGRATEMAFTNDPLSAERALEYGLVNRVVDDDDLESEAAALANRLAAGPTKAIGLTKRAFNRAILPALDETLRYEAGLQEKAGGTRDHEEGLAAFSHKRAPEFQGH